MNYSEMGKKSWNKFKSTYSSKEVKDKMSDKGRKGWLSLAEKLGGENEAKIYVSKLGLASVYRHTRPVFARNLVEPYFKIFPKLNEKFPGVKK